VNHLFVVCLFLWVKVQTFLDFLGKAGARSVLRESLPPRALSPFGTVSLPLEIFLGFSVFSFLRIFIPPESLPSGLRGRRGLSASLTNKLLAGSKYKRKDESISMEGGRGEGG